MKILRTIGSLAFVIGLFATVFIGATYMIYHEPTLPWWLKGLIYLMLSGILVVLLTVAVEQKIKDKVREKEALPIETERPILLQNSTEIPGKEIKEVLGLVQGHTIFAIWIGKDLSAMVRLILGGELTEYTEMMGRARSVATNRMIDKAQAMEADAIINVRFVTTSVVGSAAELFAYGTAVKFN